MTVHILNGDALAGKFPESLDGERIIFRECLMNGPVNETDIEAFFSRRETYLSKYAKDSGFYRRQVAAEIQKIQELPRQSVVVLWFENDLFCQCNLWFILHLLQRAQAPLRVERVFPAVQQSDMLWAGFGPMDGAALLAAYEKRHRLAQNELRFGGLLWQAYRAQNEAELIRLADQQPAAFPLLKEVVQAHIDRLPSKGQSARPKERLKLLLRQHPEMDFKEIFCQFNKSEGIYGFGDLQVKEMLAELGS